MPLLEGVAMREELAVAGDEIAEERGEARPERVGGDSRAGQRLVLDEAVQHARHPQTRDLDPIHERLLPPAVPRRAESVAECGA